MIPLRTVRDRSALSTTTIYKGVREGTFPAPVKVTPKGKASRWFDDEVAAWQKARAAKRDAKLAKRSRP
jgi:prophage regulatory protein